MVELLAPAGNYEGFLGAINGGADAVYLAGSEFGARAYADNFTEEEIIEAITYAHLWNRKVYLTVNTLLKDKELDRLYDYIKPFYLAKLDGVIVQDIGVFQYLKRYFPDLELHVSTQMAITGVYGAKALKEMGASRIVVARELSLVEVEDIIKNVDVEIELFIHGAMCYAYSGNCLFSSILGGRSGNRGKCAQPCRLPYGLEEDGKHREYLLSLKDMCLLPQLQSLLDANIHSLKIEGRMKRPEYTAGVTAIYRKYIDAYDKSPTHTIEIESRDLHFLSQLYVRSELSDGYYNRHNGKGMVTLSEPSYKNSDEIVLESIRQKYLTHKMKHEITMKVEVSVGKPIQVTVFHEQLGFVTVTGVDVLEAQNRPLTETDIAKQFQKTGNSYFKITELDILIKGNCFLPVKSLNDMRRIAFDQCTRELTRSYETRNISLQKLENVVNKKVCLFHAEKRRELHIGITTFSQWDKLTKVEEIGRVYIESELYLNDSNKCMELLEKAKQPIYVKLPYILRKRSLGYLQDIYELITHSAVKGVLVRNMEELSWLNEIVFKKAIIIDSNMYCFNSETIAYYKQKGYEIVVPYELNEHELRQLQLSGASYYCYGNIPMMITANCVAKTKNRCGKYDDSFCILQDRYDKKLPVYLSCKYCYNVIYNSVPLSLHQSTRAFANEMGMMPTMNFTNETPEEAARLVTYFIDSFSKEKRNADAIGISYTKGHLKRGVE